MIYFQEPYLHGCESFFAAGTSEEKQRDDLQAW